MSSLPTVPSPADPRVLALLSLHGLTGVPALVPVRDFHYAERMCHLSSKHHAMRHGGRRVHGWVLWRWEIPNAFPPAGVIVAEHHSIWEDPGGVLVDVTPPFAGSPMVLFVRDDSATVVEKDGILFLRMDKTSMPWCPTIFEGRPTKRRHWRMQSGALEIVSYAASLDFDLANLPS